MPYPVERDNNASLISCNSDCFAYICANCASNSITIASTFFDSNYGAIIQSVKSTNSSAVQDSDFESIIAANRKSNQVADTFYPNAFKISQQLT